MTVDKTMTSTSVVEITEPELEHEPETGHGAAGQGAGHDVHLPPESLWPISLAFAVTFIAFGLVTNFLVSIPGLILFVIALRGWAQELLHGQH